jgi:hypothetical protein
MPPGKAAGLIRESMPADRPHTPRLKALTAACCAALVLFLAVQAVAAEMRLSHLVLDNQAGEITARFGIDFMGLEELERALSEGSTLELVCMAEIVRRRSLWMNKGLAEAEFMSTLSRDALAKEYVLRLPGEQEPLRSDKLAPLIDKAWGALVMDLGPWSTLQRGQEYTLGLSVTLRRSEVPAWLRYTLFFWSWEVVPETEYQLDFSY